MLGLIDYRPIRPCISLAHAVMTDMPASGDSASTIRSRTPPRSDAALARWPSVAGANGARGVDPSPALLKSHKTTGGGKIEGRARSTSVGSAVCNFLISDDRLF